MSAVGFSPAPVKDLEQLSEAYKSLNDISRNLSSAEKCLKNDLRMADHHLRAADWHNEQAKKAIATVGQSKLASPNETK
jgi:hypothetical protein